VADLLRKIERAGSTRPLLYAVRDVRGVEHPDADPAERSGPNEEGEWTERADKALRNQHPHGGWQFPSVVIVLSAKRIGGVPWRFIDPESSRDGVRQGDSAFCTMLTGQDGDPIEIEFTDPLSLAGLAVVFEGMARGHVTFPGPTKILIEGYADMTEGLNGKHIVISIFEAL